MINGDLISAIIGVFFMEKKSKNYEKITQERKLEEQIERKIDNALKKGSHKHTTRF